MIKTFKYKLYTSKKNKYFKQQIQIACWIYNHCIALHKRYYTRYKKFLHIYRLQRHITKLKKMQKYKCWNNLNAQAIQNITERIKLGYDKFFKKESKRPPTFRKLKKYKSLTFKNNGYSYLGDNKVRIGNKIFKFFKDRVLDGSIKRMTVKRDAIGDWYISFFCEVPFENNKFMSGKTAGFDFGLKTFLTSSDNDKIPMPEFFKQSRGEIKRANKKLSSKAKKSNNRKKSHLNLARKHKQIANKRNDFQWKLARNVAIKYDILCFEDLNVKSMAKLWGRKIMDISFSSFIIKLKWMCRKFGKQIIFVDKFYPSSKTCHVCGYINQDLTLSDRKWLCPHCHTLLDRDLNAAINIHRVGASTLRLDDIRLPLEAIVVQPYNSIS